VYASRGVRVLALNPGLTRTSRVTEGLAADARAQRIEPEEALRRALDRIPLGRMAEPEEIAAVALFAASPRASYLTGVVITMDGASTPILV
jgi:NAD(P)-dependent dehydrogenase (short-subunit alcohol dehydrogenase family)